MENGMKNLNPLQMTALQAVATAARELSGKAETWIAEILDRKGISPALYRRAWEAVHDRACVVAHFHPDRITRSGLPVIDSMLATGILATQFETGVSNGSLTPFSGGPRDNWENRLFAGAYQHPDGRAGDRPKYGALDLMGFSDGAAPRFGSCYFRLRHDLTSRCSFTDKDSHQEPTIFGTRDSFDAVLAELLRRAGSDPSVLGLERPGIEGFLKRLAAMADEPVAFAANFGRTLDDYIEAQIHGPVSLETDVERLVADPSFIGTETGRSMDALCEKYKIVLDWHGGFSLPCHEVPPDFRGPRVAELARRVAEDGVLTAAVIGRAAVSLARHPEDWSDWGTFPETLQQIKQLWHVLAAFGRPLCNEHGKMTAGVRGNLLRAVTWELKTLRAIEAGPENEWPSTFDRNDVPLFEMIREELQRSGANSGSDFHLSGKPLDFLLTLVRAFVRENPEGLSEAECRELLAWAVAVLGADDRQ